MLETQRTSEIALCLDDFLLDVEAAYRADGTIRFYRQNPVCHNGDSVGEIGDGCGSIPEAAKGLGV